MTTSGGAGPTGTTRRGSGRIVRLVQFAFALGLAAVIAFGLYSITREQTAGDAPQVLAGMRLLETETGQAAVSEMGSLHRSDIRISGGWVGHYEHSAVVFVGDAQSRDDAARLVAEMTARIVQGNDMFVHQGQQQLDGLTVHIVKSGAQLHYYYERGSKVIWIAAPVGMDPGGFVGEALERVS